MEQHAAYPTRRPRRLLGLFAEAWQRQRQRRTRLALILLAVLAAAAILWRADRPTDGQGAASPAVFARLTSGALPTSGHFASLTQVGGKLIAAGGPGNRPLNVSGAVTSLSHGRVVGRCTAATVAPHTVHLERLAHANCGDPALYGLHAMPIMSARRSHGPTGLTVGVRVALADPTAANGYRLGPILFSYEQCSDCAAQWVIGDHALWISSPLAHGPRGPGEVLRISTTTGRVLQRFATPRLYNPVLAVDADGLWVAPSILTGVAGRRTPASQRASTALYLDSPHARNPIDARHVGEGVSWLTASGHRVWVGEIAHGSVRMLTFTGAPVHGLRAGPREHVGRSGSDELGNGAIPYAVDPDHAVYGIGAPNSTHQTVIAYNTTTLTAKLIATTPSSNALDEQPDAAAVGSSLYFLNAQSGSLPARLYRLTGPRSATAG